MQGFCPNCNNNIKDASNVILTEESKIFKGHNVYCMCKHCGYVMVYNLDRDLIFSLDRFKDDEDIIKEIHELLSKASDVELEVVAKDIEETKDIEEVEERPVESGCQGNCSTCSGCHSHDDLQAGNLIAMNLKSGDISIIRNQEQLNSINVDDYKFFELNEVIVERVVSYKIQRM